MVQIEMIQKSRIRVLFLMRISQRKRRIMTGTLLEKPRAFDPRGRVVLTPSGEIALTLRVEIKMTPENRRFSGAFWYARHEHCLKGESPE